MLEIRVKDAQKLTETIIKSGYTKRSLARAINVSNSFISQITTGRKNPSPKVAKKLCDELHINFDDYFVIDNRGAENDKTERTCVIC